MPTSGLPTCICRQGWVCELHPNHPWEHGTCRAAGAPCPRPDCPWWKQQSGEPIPAMTLDKVLARLPDECE